MKFERIFVEHDVANHWRTKAILAKLHEPLTVPIRKVEDVFGRVVKPYLHKRDTMNLFIGRKEGALLKKTPDAYGNDAAPRYYFIHQYNCIYECEYCYLQGYFTSPDLVVFVNHDEICAEIRRLCLQVHKDELVWFHAGEFSDSLALSGLTREWEEYWETFTDLPYARLELRTKSVNIRPLLELSPLQNVVVSFSLAPQAQIEKFDHRTPPLAARLQAIQKLARYGYRIGIHFDPIIQAEGLEESYRSLLRDLFKAVRPGSIAYLSLGTVRFAKDVFRKLSQNYPNSQILAQEFVVGSDGKRKYFRPLRLQILNSIRQLSMAEGLAASQIYLCMEDFEP